MKIRHAFLALILLAQPTASVADEPNFADQLPRIKPMEPDEAIKAFKIADGYRIELAASEPIVSDPIAMHFDEDGRLFVVEMRDYPESQPKDGGCVRLLIDTNDDGVFDKSTIYIDKLAWPTAVFCWDGGIFVAAAPDIIYCKDTNGDGVADYRKVIYTGFGTQNVQGLVNSFRWGLDNRIHGSASSNGGMIRRVASDLLLDRAKPHAADTPDTRHPTPASVNVRGRDFAFDPRTLKFEATSGGAQHGMCFDDFGNKFVCSNSDHLQQVMFELKDVERNPFLAAPGPRLSIAADGPQAEVYRISPVEPWRILRTKLRVAGKVPGPVEGGGRPAGYFTGSTGVTIYRGDALPGLRGMAFIGDVGSNIVHRKMLTGTGLPFNGERIDEKKEFLASSDIWFRPVQFGEGPDGCLYVLDMYREVIEHPASLVPAIKKHLDLTSGQGKGRIWRIVPEGFERRGTPKGSIADTGQLLAVLDHQNAWHRETAARLIYQRQDKDAIPHLRQRVRNGEDAVGIIHALYSLRGLDALDEASVQSAIDSRSLRQVTDRDLVLIHGVKLATQVNAHSPVLRLRLDSLASIPDPRVRYHLAFALGARQDAQKVAPLATILAESVDDRWITLAVLSASLDCSGELLAKSVTSTKVHESKQGRATLEQLAAMTGRLNDPKQVAAAKSAIASIGGSDAELAKTLSTALSNGLARAVKDPSAALPATPEPKPISNEPRREKEYEPFKPALALKGAADKGGKLFLERCAVCHKLDGTGNEVGPNLAAMAARGAEAILLNVIDPNREVNPLFTSYNIRMKDGEIHSGIITGETGTSLELIGPKAEKKTLLRVDIESIQSTGLSLMPEALEQGMDPQAMADLIAYLMKAR